MSGKIIYLDNAATTYPKPLCVLARTAAQMRRGGGNPGRGGHTMAVRAAETVYACRERAAAFFGAPGAENVCFTLNTTYALNTALKSVLRRGDHVLVGNMEHNSVMRPLAALARERGITSSVFDMRQDADALCAQLSRLIRPSTRALVCTHVPNTANYILPAAAVGAFCRARGILFILDGAQSAGVLPIDMSAMQLDILCVPGHKGLFGPQGCGMMILGEKCPVGRTLAEGGGGVRSLESEMPDELPEHFEAGTLPVPAIAGLDEGMAWIGKIGLDAVRHHECRLWQLAHELLSANPRIRIADGPPGAILMFTADGLPPASIAEALDRRGICVRAGYHCAPGAHRILGTGKDGAVRASFSIMNTEEDVRSLAAALAEIVR